jgi:hypothetical protein
MAMKILWGVVITVLGMTASPAGAAKQVTQHGDGIAQEPAAGISGAWSATFTIAGQSVPVLLKFAEKDGEVTGTVESDHTGPGTINNGTWKDNTLNCTLKFEKHESIALNGTLKGEIFAGEFKTEGMQGTWEAKRGGTKTVGHASVANPYEPYEFLIGEWDVARESGGVPMAVQRFNWRSGHAYIWYAGSLMMNGQEQPHFEGMLMWNGVNKNLDMLLTLDLRYGLAQEHGTVYVQADGTVVREVTGVFSEGVLAMGQPRVGPEGWTGRFRQTFKKVESGKVLTSVMRESEGKWVATFPGSDHLVMTARAKS